VLAGTPDEDVVAELSGPVLAAVEQAERLVLDMIAESARGASRDRDIDRGDMA
jgi:hypothetical protein